MNFEQLKYAVEVAKTRSLLHAAERLHITQSALSQSISKLENELDVKIFDRSRAGTVPTDMGNTIIEKAREILEKHDELKKETCKQQPEQVKIGTVPYPSKTLPRSVALFKVDHPHVHVDIIEKASSQEILEDIVQDKLELGIISINDGPTEILDKKRVAYHTLECSNMVMAVSKQSPLAYAKSVSPQEILKHPLVLCSNIDGIWEFINNLEKQYEPANILFSSNDPELVQNAVIENLGITIAPEYAIMNTSSVINGENVPVKIEGLEQKYGLVLAWSKSISSVSVVKPLISRLKLNMQDLKHSIRSF